MTVKERWKAALHMQPLDRMLFWPKLQMSYPKAQTSSFRGMSPDDIQQWIGSDRHEWLLDGFQETRTTTSVTTTSENGIRRTLYSSPLGSTEQIYRFDEASHSFHPVRFPITDKLTIQLMTQVFQDTNVSLDDDMLQDTKDQHTRYGDDVFTAVVVGESPLMHVVEHLAGVENAHLLLFDFQTEMEALFEAMHQVLLKKCELLAQYHPADVLYMIENTSTTLISPQQYRTYCYSHISEYAAIARQYGKDMLLHMCGHLKALLPDLATLSVEGFEAFTSPTLGNTTLLDGRTACPDKCLIGGTNAMLWTEPAATIIQDIEESLAALPHHRGIVLTSSGVMPPSCPPSTIKEVCAWVQNYAVRY